MDFAIRRPQIDFLIFLVMLLIVNKVLLVLSIPLNKCIFSLVSEIFPLDCFGRQKKAWRSVIVSQMHRRFVSGFFFPLFNFNDNVMNR